MKKFLPLIIIFSLIASIYPIWLGGEALSFEQARNRNETIHETEAKLEELIILNPHAHPGAGDYWSVSFQTKGTADLIITPDDQVSIDDLDFISLKCGDEERTPQILKNGVVYYPNWQCNGSSRMKNGSTQIHGSVYPWESAINPWESVNKDSNEATVSYYVKRSGKHQLEFRYGDQTKYAYNSPTTPNLWSKLESADDVTSPQLGTGGSVAGSPTYPACRFGNGIFCDLDTEYALFPTAANNINNSKGAIECWWKPNFDPDHADDHYIWSFYDPDNGGILLTHAATTDKLRIVVCHDNGEYAVILDAVYAWTTGDVIHLAVTWDREGNDIGGGKTLVFKADNVEIGSSTNTWNADTIQADLYVGVSHGPDKHSDAVIDNLKTYNICKTDFSDRETEGVNQAPTAPTTLYSNNTDASSCCNNPTNLTDTTPVFSAIYNDPDSGDQANQYRLQVDDNSNFSSPIWDSSTSSMATTTEGNRGPDIEYSGSTLSYNTTYYWRIRFLDDDGAAGAWSTTTSYFKIFSGYEMGSDTYRVWQSSINVGGHSVQTSTSYRMRETIGEIATGISTSTLYKLFAGYQQMQEVYLALSAPSQVTMSPSIGGVSGGTSNGLATTTVTTDSPSGYSLSVRASASPAMATSSYSFADYIPAIAGTPDYTWSIPATTSEFGFTPEGSDIVQKFLDNGSDTCNTGSSETTDACWYNFSTPDETIAQTYSANHPSGTQTIIKFKAESGTSNIQAPGEYQATITITAIPN